MITLLEMEILYESIGGGLRLADSVQKLVAMDLQGGMQGAEVEGHGDVSSRRSLGGECNRLSH